MDSKQTYILKVGGSILSPEDNKLFDFGYAYKLASLLSTLPDKRFVLAVGGGRLARTFMEQAKNFGEKEEKDINMIGIAAVNMNAEILRGILSVDATAEVLRYDDYEHLVTTPGSIDWESKRILVVAAGHPGQSSDWNAAQLAKSFAVGRVYSLKDVAGVYTADPAKDPQATLLPKLTWQAYMDVIGNPDEFAPGGNFPVDPITARHASESNLEYIVLAGRELENLKAALVQEVDFVGTIISNN
jgi:uridylate kinase